MTTGLRSQPPTTAQVADACLQLGVPLRLAPVHLPPLQRDVCVSGPALPIRHAGSVDVFLEALSSSRPGDLLVVDNDGRRDEGCLGDLVAMEAAAMGIAGIVIWGCHRDTRALREVGLPLFSHGACPVGPRRLDPRPAGALERGFIGDLPITRGETVFADEDGIAVVADRVGDVIAAAQAIGGQERRQAHALRAGHLLQDQLRFPDFLDHRSRDPGFTFRDHLRAIGGAIEV